MFAGANTKRLPFVSFFSPFFLDKQKEWAPGGKGTSVRKMTASRDMDCRVAALLAMTEEAEARAQTINYICHCEAPKGPWQSLGSNGREIAGERDFPEIAASLRSSQ